MSAIKIRFPVLRRLRVTNYELFPGKDRKGINHTFERGVTVLLGVNGLGKTTMLNMILRSLIGDYEPAKFDPYNPGAGVHKMVKQDSEYFAERTTNFASDATVDAEFIFGKTRVRVVRHLRTLDIQRLWLNRKEMKGTQHDLQHEIVKASGLTNLYDFFYIVRSFTFFLEDKVSLIWNPRGQFEIFRILFFDAERSKLFAELGDEIRRLDSQYRNLRVYINKRAKDLQQSEQNTTDDGQLREELRLKQVDVSSLEEKESDVRQQIDRALSRKTNLLERLEKLRLTHEEQQSEFEGLLSTYFSRAYPDLSAVVGNVLNHLVSGQGCLVCGTAPVKKHVEYREKAERGICPFCETNLGRQSKRRPLSAKTSADIRKLESTMQNTRGSISTVQNEMQLAQSRLNKLYETRGSIAADAAGARVAVDQLRNRLPPSDEELDERRRDIDKGQRDLRKMKAEIEEMTSRYEKILAVSRETLKELSDTLTTRFHYYAGEFLAENCSLAYGEERRSLGQEGEVLAFPNFQVVMTSAVSPKIGTARLSDTQVSESQKEFIDLAFRMGLFDAVRQKGDGVMLVIETPEASLDTVFVDRAGALLRKFANENSGQYNVVLASSNLTSANMIRSLLGIDRLTKRELETEVPKRIINLLELAAPNAAVRQDLHVYKKELARSLGK
jgi:AAA domain